jgi:hypothetical protein
MDLSNSGIVDSGQQLEVTWAKPPNANNWPQKKSYTSAHKKCYYSGPKKSYHSNGFNLNQSFSDLVINRNFVPNYGSEVNAVYPYPHMGYPHLRLGYAQILSPPSPQTMLHTMWMWFCDRTHSLFILFNGIFHII